MSLKKRFISDLEPGGAVEGVFLLASARQGQSRNGPYWRLEFKDTSGSMEGKIWPPLSAQFQDLRSGLLVQVRGRVELYRDRGQMVVEDLRLLDEARTRELNLADFIPASRRAIPDMLEELEDLCRKTLVHAPWKKFYRQILKDEEIAAGLRLAPAAKNMHHACAGGLLEHTLGVCRAVLSMSGLYPVLDRQTLLAGALCHDLGKIRELGSGLVIEYTTAGRLIGHITLGLEMLDPFLRRSDLEAELAEHLRHLILSHHGSLEFGSPCLPATAEALALHFADNLDAKLNQVENALEGSSAGGNAWSDFAPGLERRLFRPAATPEPLESVDKKPSARREVQCSLPWMPDAGK
ncbi:MAG: HD domain-containing protein [Desulfovibrionaceae bacterium]|nr:HD domain-containing protein [Desulfovibrionaceae bacterium]